jgi:hypothetical protein
MLHYLELKAGHQDDGPAWIGRVRTSQSGRTVYFNGRAFRRSKHAGKGSNHFDVETLEAYWISGVKKEGGDRHWAGKGKITIDATAVDEYLQLRGLASLDPQRYVVSTAIAPTDATKFHELANQRMPTGEPDEGPGPAAM